MLRAKVAPSLCSLGQHSIAPVIPCSRLLGPNPSDAASFSPQTGMMLLARLPSASASPSPPWRRRGSVPSTRSVSVAALSRSVRSSAEVGGPGVLCRAWPVARERRRYLPSAAPLRAMSASLSHGEPRGKVHPGSTARMTVKVVATGLLADAIGHPDRRARPGAPPSPSMSAPAPDSISISRHSGMTAD